jgi:hypothetical protein
MSQQKESLKRLIDKLMSAGWIKRSAIYDAKLSGKSAHGIGIEWTKQGQERIYQLLSLISEIENTSTPFSEKEWKYLKVIAKNCPIQGGSDGETTDNSD